MVGGVSLPVGASRQTVSFPETLDRIHVFNDQINLYYATDGLIEFVATHYDGTQKIPVDQTRRIRAVNPNFIVLHYRLGLGLGYRAAEGDCQPTGEELLILDGVDWVREWPETELPEDYFYHLNGERVYLCDWGWYLMDLDNPDYRAWWLDQVRTQLVTGEYSGLFADSLSVPNSLGATSFRPALPDLDETFEGDWVRRLHDWMVWLNDELGDQYVLIPNAGAWITTRDQTDYSPADGVMIECFVGWGWSDRFAVEDWQLQLDRILSLTNQDKIVIMQSYVEDFSDQLWVIANYLLVKGRTSYVNLDTLMEAEWFPLYDLPIGPAVDPLVTASDQLFGTYEGLAAREYENALVLVNPDPVGEARTVTLPEPLWLVTGQIGGGMVPEDGLINGWTVTTEQVQEVTIQPGQAAILLRTEPE
jgi:hypothetical protein